MEYELLAGLSDGDKRAVLQQARRRKFKRGEVLFHEGDPGATFHLLAGGTVGVRVTTMAGDVAMISVLGAGMSFGEQALLPGTSERTATIIALEDVETLSLTRDDFHELRREHEAIGDALLEELARQVRHLSTQLAEVAYLSADQRVFRRVLQLHDVFSLGVVPITQDDIASMAATTRSTANRALQDAVDKGFLQLGRGKFEVLDRAGIEKLAR